MALPSFTNTGNLPAGMHAATLQETVERFGANQGARRRATQDLVHVYELARRTGYLQRFVLFGSYVTAKANPNDVDVVLVVADAFDRAACPPETWGLFDHAVAQVRFGASIFWTRPGFLIDESVDDFIAYWQITREGYRRGIVEVIP